MSAYELSTGTLSEDARGRWYLNVVAKTQPFVGSEQPGPTQAVGIDLGLKDFLTTSEGLKVGANQFYRDLALARAQRAKKSSARARFTQKLPIAVKMRFTNSAPRL